MVLDTGPEVWNAVFTLQKQQSISPKAQSLFKPVFPFWNDVETWWRNVLEPKSKWNSSFVVFKVVTCLKNELIILYFSQLFKMKNQWLDGEWWISGKAQCIWPSMVGLLFPICFTMKSNPCIFIFFRTVRSLQRCVSSSCYIFYWELPSGSLIALKKSCKYYPVCICATTKGVEALTHKQAGVNPIKVTQPWQNLCDSVTLKHESNTYFLCSFMYISVTLMR